MTAVYLSVAETAPSRYTAPPTTADVLHRAADLLEEFGWVRGHSGVPDNEGFDRDKGFCVLGAIMQADFDFGGGPMGAGSYLRAGEYLPAPNYSYRREYGLTPGTPWWRWNDEPGRTKAEVVAKLREAAEAAA